LSGKTIHWEKSVFPHRLSKISFGPDSRQAGGAVSNTGDRNTERHAKGRRRGIRALHECKSSREETGGVSNKLPRDNLNKQRRMEDRLGRTWMGKRGTTHVQHTRKPSV